MKARFENVRVLVVDDEPAICEFLVEEFAHLGAKTAAAGNATEAMAKLRAGWFDLIVTDARMPDGDGIELLKRVVSEIEPKPGIVFLTGYTDVEPDEIKRLGADALLWKPFHLKDLNEAAEQALEKTRVQREVFLRSRKSI